MELNLCGRNNDGSLTGNRGTVFCANGFQAEEALVKFHGPPALDELGYDAEEKNIILRPSPGCGSVINLR